MHNRNVQKQNKYIKAHLSYQKYRSHYFQTWRKKKELRQVLARTQILYQETVIEFKTKQKLIKELNQVQKSISKLDIKLIAILLPRHLL